MHLRLRHPKSPYVRSWGTSQTCCLPNHCKPPRWCSHWAYISSRTYERFTISAFLVSYPASTRLVTRYLNSVFSIISMHLPYNCYPFRSRHKKARTWEIDRPLNLVLKMTEQPRTLTMIPLQLRPRPSPNSPSDAPRVCPTVAAPIELLRVACSSTG